MTDFDYANFDRLLPSTPGVADWDEVMSRANGQGRRRRIVMLATATVLVASATAGVGSILTLPWGGSPSFLERAEAALTPPEGTILHYKVELSRTSIDFGCTDSGLQEKWIDQMSPYAWRAIEFDPPDPTAFKTADTQRLVCSHWPTHEIGAPSNELGTLEFVPPSTVRVAPLQTWMAPTDPVAALRDEIRQALATGRAHSEGVTEIDGRTVVRYRLDCRVTPCPSPNYVYMDPETFLPVRYDASYGWTLVVDGALLPFDTVERFLTIEYLPRTPENLALTDIRAQHPDARP